MCRTAPIISAFVASIVGCTVTSPQPTSLPLQTTLRSAKPCPKKTCACRTSNGPTRQTEIPKGTKRFEFRLPRSTAALWVKVRGHGVFYKAPQDVEPTCFYLDFPAGTQRITLVGANRDADVGLQAGLTIREYGEKAGPDWYRSFHLACGAEASRCTQSELGAWRAFQQKLPRGVLDLCGSTMIKDVSMSGNRRSRQSADYEDLTIRFALEVYGFDPYHPSGSPECKGPTPNR